MMGMHKRKKRRMGTDRRMGGQTDGRTDGTHARTDEPDRRTGGRNKCHYWGDKKCHDRVWVTAEHVGCEEMCRLSPWEGGTTGRQNTHNHHVVSLCVAPSRGAASGLAEPSPCARGGAASGILLVRHAVARRGVGLVRQSHILVRGAASGIVRPATH